MNHEITLKWDEQGRTKTGRTKAVRVFQKINNLLEKKDTVQFLSNPPHGRLFVVFPAGSPFAENNKHQVIEGKSPLSLKVVRAATKPREFRFLCAVIDVIDKKKVVHSGRGDELPRPGHR